MGRFNGSEHHTEPLAIESWQSPGPGGNEPTHPEIVFCEGSGLLWSVQLHPSRWLSQGNKARLRRETHSQTPHPRGRWQRRALAGCHRDT